MTIDFTKLSELSAFGKPVDQVLIKKDGEWKEIWSAVEKDIIFGASDGAVVKYIIKQLSNDNVPAYTLQYRGGTNRTVQQPYQSNPHLSSDITDKETYISNIVHINDKNGHILTAGPQACFKCSNLKCVNLPNATFVDTAAFAYSDLSNINIPQVTRLRNNVFYSISNLISIDLPSVTQFEDYTFGMCRNLRDVYITSQNTTPSIRPTTFYYGNDKLSAIWVKNETYKSYLTASDNWQNISSHISSVTQPIVSFLSGENYDTLVKSEKLNYGMSATIPTIIPSKEGYEFIGWQDNYNNVISDTSCYAVWKEQKKIKFLASNNEWQEYNICSS